VTRSAAITPQQDDAARESRAEPLEIGLVNNMPDAALEATERQFRALLDAAASDVSVRLTLYALPDVPRSDASRHHIAATYSTIDTLWTQHLDGLIITGTEPRAQNLRAEPYWESLAQLFDWANLHTASTVCSCLAAHAAVLHFDGIVRRPLPDKRFGVFDCSPSPDQPLTYGMGSRMVMPHSRWNDLPEQDLVASGYQMLARSDEAGVDAFVKHRNSLFVFFQGHPEYEAQTLLLEYRRDVRRFLKGERETYPQMPRGYFDAVVTEAMSALRERAARERSEDLLTDFPMALAADSVRGSWQPAAMVIYRNWLQYLAARKQLKLALR
jgi:homoserine O-succinyltransferase